MSEQSFVRALFHGVIAEDLLAAAREPTEAERDRTGALVSDVRRRLAPLLDSATIDRDGALPNAALAKARELGLFGLEVPRSRGGLGLSAAGAARVAQELGGLDASLAHVVTAHGLVAATIGKLGTDEQRASVLPRLASGELVGAFALTEVSAGSDAAGVRTRLRESADGYVLTGTKTWVSGAERAGLVLAIARSTDVDLAKKPRLTAVLVEATAPGVRVGPSQPRLGVRGAGIADVSFDSVAVPRSALVGEVGKGFRVAVEAMAAGRLQAAASAFGAVRALLKLTIARVGERRAFHRNLGELGLVKDKVASLLCEAYALESMVFVTAGLADAGANVSLESALCKLFASEVWARTANEALQLAGASGYAAGSPHERALRDARGHALHLGTSEILRCFVALSGMEGPGRALADVARALREPIKGFGLLGDFALRKAKSLPSLQSLLGRERLTRVHRLLARESVIFEDYGAELGRMAEALVRKHGAELPEMQLAQRRVADLALELYALVATLTRTSRAVEARGEEGARRELDLAVLFANSAHKRLRQLVSDGAHNDDELRKAVASRAYTDGGYPFDLL